MDEQQPNPVRQRVTFSMRDLLYFIVIPAYVMGVLRLIINVRPGPTLMVFALGPTFVILAVLLYLRSVGRPIRDEFPTIASLRSSMTVDGRVGERKRLRDFVLWYTGLTIMLIGLLVLIFQVSVVLPGRAHHSVISYRRCLFFMTVGGLLIVAGGVLAWSSRLRSRNRFWIVAGLTFSGAAIGTWAGPWFGLRRPGGAFELLFFAALGGAVGLFAGVLIVLCLRSRNGPRRQSAAGLLREVRPE